MAHLAARQPAAFPLQANPFEVLSADAVPEDIPEPNAGAADTEASAAAEALPGPLADAGVLIGLEQLLAQLRTCPAAVQATTLDQVRAGLVAGT
jgi:hypothetical protein